MDRSAIERNAELVVCIRGSCALIHACSNATLPRAQAKTKVVEWDSVGWEHYKKVVEWGSLRETLAQTSKLFFGGVVLQHDDTRERD